MEPKETEVKMPYERFETLKNASETLEKLLRSEGNLQVYLYSYYSSSHYTVVEPTAFIEKLGKRIQELDAENWNLKHRNFWSRLFNIY